MLLHKTIDKTLNIRLCSGGSDLMPARAFRRLAGVNTTAALSSRWLPAFTPVTDGAHQIPVLFHTIPNHG